MGLEAIHLCDGKPANSDAAPHRRGVLPAPRSRRGREARTHRRGEGFVVGPPDLAIEVISPSNLDSEVALKLEHYLQAGVQRVWVVRPRTKTVTIHHPDHNARTLLVGSTLTSDDAGFTTPGFELALDTLFEGE